MKSIGERIKHKRKKLGLSQKKVADYIGTSSSAISQIETGDTKGLKPHNLVKIAEILQTTEKELTFGIKGTFHASEPYSDSFNFSKIVEWDNKNDISSEIYIFIPRVSFSLSIVSGKLMTKKVPGEELAFKREWLKQRGIINPDNVFFMVYDGAGMLGTFSSGSTLLINSEITEIIDDKVYVVGYDDKIKTRILYNRIDGGIILKSSNEKYPDETINKKDIDDKLQIFGQVFWQAGDI